MRRSALTFVIVAMATTLLEAAPPRCLESFSATHVKAADATHRALVHQGLERSATFRRLIADIEASSWLVFVQTGRCPENVTVACLLHFVGTFDGKPYLRVIARHEDRHPDKVISVLAHELQHAREVVQAAGREDPMGLRDLFGRIGRVSVKRPGVVTYETDRARQVEAAVWRELLGAPDRCVLDQAADRTARP